MIKLSPAAEPSAPNNSREGEDTGLPAEGEAPPAYTTLPRSPSEAGPSLWTGPGGGAGAGYAPSGVRLGYVDFVPRVVRKRFLRSDIYETFE